MAVLYLLTLLGSACGRGDAAPRDSGVSAGAPAAGTANATEASNGASGSPAVRVVFVGTSLTAGLGLDPDSAFPARIQRKADSAGLAIAVVNAGLSGETSAGALRRIDWLLQREPADVVVLETGANDGLRALPVEATRANIQAIVRRIRAVAPRARVVLVQMQAPPNLGARYTSAFSGMFPSIARQEGLTLAPFLLEGVAGVARLNQADGVHPNDAGERRVADNVWRAIEPVLRAGASAAPAARTTG
jgi:acyl-CoA thioesterase-1